MPDKNSDNRLKSNAHNEVILLSKISDKDKCAFEELYRLYYHRIFQFILRMTKQPELAEETVDDTMFTVWEKASAFESRSSVSTWIFGIAYRRALKSLEKNKKHKQSRSVDENQLADYADPNPESNPETLSTNESFQQLLRKGIDQLTENHRIVIELSTMGYAYDEIAKIVDCPTNTVKTRMFHARRQLKDYLVQSEYKAVISGDRKLWASNQ